MKQENKPTYKGLTFDSVGEMHFYWWCEELMELGIIKEIKEQPDAFVLSNKEVLSYVKPMKKTEDKIIEKTILNGHEYTPDFKIVWDPSAEDFFFVNIDRTSPLQNKETIDLIKGDVSNTTFIEVKPAFDQNNMTRLAVLNQKWVMDKFNIFINIVIPEKLFEKTFTPHRYLTCDKSPKPRTIKYKNIKTVKDFINFNPDKAPK